MKADWECLWRKWYDVVSEVGDEDGKYAVQNMKLTELLWPVMEVWKAHLIRIIPDPAQARKSEHAEHAAWAKALQELNPEAYAKLLDRWRKKHNRRRNLWRAMKAQDLAT